MKTTAICVGITIFSLLWSEGGSNLVSSGVATGAYYFYSCYNECGLPIDIRVHLIDSTHGVYGFSSYRGTFGIGSEDTTIKLMYNYPRTWEIGGAGSQHVILNIDGDCYSQYQMPSFMGYSVPADRNLRYFYVNPVLISHTALDEPESSIVTHWTIPLIGGNIEFYQYLTPVKISLGDTTVGQIQIRYVALNSTPYNHSIGLALFMDLMVRNTDQPIWEIEGSLENHCVLLYTPTPSYWQAWENPENPNSAVARGICRGYGATPPDLIALGDYPDLSVKPWIPSGTPRDIVFADSYYVNSSVFLEWFPVPVPPGAQVSFITYYGFGRRTLTPSPEYICMEILTDGRVLETDCHIPDTILALALITNTNSLAIDIHNVEACLAVPSPLQVWNYSMGTWSDSACTTISFIHIDSSALAIWTVYIPPFEAWNDTFALRYWSRAEEFPEWCSRVGTLIVDTISLVSYVPKLDISAKFFPNPSNSSVNIKIVLPEPMRLDLSISDIFGREIKNWSAVNFNSGENTIVWDGTDSSGKPTPTGIYIVTAKANGFSLNKPIYLIK